jgi:hypothetical protein
LRDVFSTSETSRAISDGSLCPFVVLAGLDLFAFPLTVFLVFDGIAAEDFLGTLDAADLDSEMDLTRDLDPVFPRVFSEPRDEEADFDGAPFLGTLFELALAEVGFTLADLFFTGPALLLLDVKSALVALA